MTRSEGEKAKCQSGKIKERKPDQRGGQRGHVNRQRSIQPSWSALKSLCYWGWIQHMKSISTSNLVESGKRTVSLCIFVETTKFFEATNWKNAVANNNRNTSLGVSGYTQPLCNDTVRPRWMSGIKHAVTFQGDDFASRIHDGAVGRDGPPDRVGGVRHVHNHHLVLIPDLLSDADELVRLHGEVAEPDVCRVHTHVLQLERFQQETSFD